MIRDVDPSQDSLAAVPSVQWSDSDHSFVFAIGSSCTVTRILVVNEDLRVTHARTLGVGCQVWLNCKEKIKTRCEVERRDVVSYGLPSTRLCFPLTNHVYCWEV